MILFFRLKDEPKHRQGWAQSEKLAAFVKSWINRTGQFHSGDDDTKKEFAGCYFREPIHWKLDFHSLCHGGFLFVWVVLQLAALFFSACQQKAAGVIFLMVLGCIAGMIAIVFQWLDGYKPTLRAKFHHGLFSVIYLAFSLAAYSLGAKSGQVEDESHDTNGLYLLLTGIASLLPPLSFFRQFLKGAAGDLGRTSWGVYPSLFWKSTPPKEVIWESLPDSEKLWAVKTLQIMIAERTDPSRSSESRPSSVRMSSSSSSKSPTHHSSHLGGSYSSHPHTGPSTPGPTVHSRKEVGARELWIGWDQGTTNGQGTRLGIQMKLDDDGSQWNQNIGL